MSHVTATAASREHQIRPGLILRWGSALAVSPYATAQREITPPLLAFILANDVNRARDRMALLRTLSADAGNIVSSPVVFHATLELSSEAWEELLADKKIPGHAAIRIFANTPSAPALELPLTPAARLAVESIRRCPFVGACRAMALVARGNDLLVEFLTALAAAETPVVRLPAPMRSMMEQIEAAAALLKQNLENPPALSALARHAGLSETTLKRGFHQVFGTTVFGYLRARRMEHARTLLQSGEATVLEAAELVGYSNPSNFASAFRREFGVNPKTFQLTARR